MSYNESAELIGIEMNEWIKINNALSKHRQVKEYGEEVLE